MRLSSREWKLILRPNKTRDRCFLTHLQPTECIATNINTKCVKYELAYIVIMTITCLYNFGQFFFSQISRAARPFERLQQMRNIPPAIRQL